MDTAAANKRCEAATKGPWDWGDSYILLDQWGRDVTALVANRSFIRYARTDLPAALEALEEAQAEIERLNQLAAYYPTWLPRID